MSSAQHTPGRAPKLRDASRRNLPAVLAHDQQRTADVRPVIYHSRVGRDKHLVRNQGSDIVYSVGGPAQSFKPGTIVFAGSNTGRPGESIIALPSPAQRGASAYPESRVPGSVSFPAAEDPPAFGCPVYDTYPYIGIGDDTATDTLYAWNYTDGTPGSLIATKPYNSALGSKSPKGFQYVPSLGNVVVFIATSVAEDAVVAWDLDANTLTVATATNIGAWCLVGSTAYFMPSGSDSEKSLYSVTAGTTGPATLVSTLSDVSGGAGWWTYFGSVLIPLSTTSVVCGARSTQVSGTESFYFADFLSGAPQFASLGSNATGSSSEAQELATNTNQGHSIATGGIAFHNRLLNPGVQGPLTAVKIPTAATSYIKLIPSAWNIDGDFLVQSAVSTTALVGSFVQVDAGDTSLIRIPITGNAPFGDSCSPTIAAISPATDGVGSPFFPDALIPTT